jgi:hypothetical protein
MKVPDPAAQGYFSPPEISALPVTQSSEALQAAAISEG